MSPSNVAVLDLLAFFRNLNPPCARQEVGSGSFDVVARHMAVGVEGGALTAELDGRQFAAALESYMHADEEVRLMRLSAFLASHASKDMITCRIRTVHELAVHALTVPTVVNISSIKARQFIQC